jgi:hypothetical protein
MPFGHFSPDLQNNKKIEKKLDKGTLFYYITSKIII